MTQIATQRALRFVACALAAVRADVSLVLRAFALMAGVSGILIAPVNTMFYDSGFLLGLKAFVGAIVGGMTSYPGAALGAFGVGILESFASFQSSTLKDVIVFSLLIPVLLWRSFVSQHSEEEVEE